MYTFIDKGERNVTLRPEGTASAVRAYLEAGLKSDQLLNGTTTGLCIDMRRLKRKNERVPPELGQKCSGLEVLIWMQR